MFSENHILFQEIKLTRKFFIFLRTQIPVERLTKKHRKFYKLIRGEKGSELPSYKQKNSLQRLIIDEKPVDTLITGWGKD